MLNGSLPTEIGQLTNLVNLYPSFLSYLLSFFLSYLQKFFRQNRFKERKKKKKKKKPKSIRYLYRNELDGSLPTEIGQLGLLQYM